MSQSPLPSCAQSHRTGLEKAVLAEIGVHLERLAGDPSLHEAIDLRSLPMTDADREALRAVLGMGEVSIALDVAGDSDITETAYAGVWWLTHKSADGKISVEQLVIARIPEIVLAPMADIAQAARHLVDMIPASTDATEDSAPKEAAHG